MDIRTDAAAGTLESSDVLVKVSPADELQVEITSSVLAQYGDAIRAVVDETLKELDVTKARVELDDKGALDCTIRARVQAACLRATGSDEIDWSKL